MSTKLSFNVSLLAVAFFDEAHLPKLSTERNTEAQIKTIFEYLKDENKATIFD